MILFIDTETRSPVPIRNGTYRYATQAEVIIVTWAVDDGEVQLWDCLAKPEPPVELLEAAVMADRIVAHNATFDRTLLNTTDWWPRISIETWYCTMAMAYRHGLPGGLDKLCTVFKVTDEQAKADGHELIQLFCKPRKDGSWATGKTHPQKWWEFKKYAQSDIRAMRRIYQVCPKWNDSPTELAVWAFDQRTNDRGFPVDTEFAKAAVRATTAEQKRLGDQTEELTSGTVLKATQRDALLGFLFAEFGIDLPDLKADTVERRLNDPELPEYVKEILRIRAEASKSSTSKYKTLLATQVGDRIYGSLQYGGAYRTLRWAGRLFQPQNLTRPTHKAAEIENFIEMAKAGCEDLIGDSIMRLASSSLRGAIRATLGRKLVGADLSNIEGRGVAWLAGEQWKLDAFEAFDAGLGPDLYKMAYGRSFNVDPDTVEDDSDERQVGKVMELALGYQGGVSAFVSMAAVYKLDLEHLANAAWETIPAHVMAESQRLLAKARQRNRTYGLPDRVWLVCQSLVSMWRAAHPNIEALWESAENAARNAIQNPGIDFPAGKLVFNRRKAWLRMQLPSGRYLCYPQPALDGHAITFKAWNVYRNGWYDEYTYGGKLVENAAQAVARDVLAHALLRIEKKYPLVLSVHDEPLAEIPDTEEYSAVELSQMLTAGEPWTAGLPLAAKGREMYRYGKG